LMLASQRGERGKDCEVTSFLRDRRKQFEVIGRMGGSTFVMSGATPAEPPGDGDEELRMAETDQMR
jgi:hypothetical protein